MKHTCLLLPSEWVSRLTIVFLKKKNNPDCSCFISGVSVVCVWPVCVGCCFVLVHVCVMWVSCGLE